jgi:uncharacterized SAM-binding protein YcdF (DUF218 family)
LPRQDDNHASENDIARESPVRFRRHGSLEGDMLRLARNLILTCLIVGGLALGAGFFFFVDALERNEVSAPSQVDGIVALTGGAERIADAMDLLAKGHGGRLLITGVNAKTTREEIVRLRPDLRPYFACCVDLDYRALNTIGNAEQTRHWVERHGFRSILVVTSTYHMPRTLTELNAVLPGVRVVPHPVVPGTLDIDGWWHDPPLAKLLALEYVKFVAAIARTTLAPAPSPGQESRTAAGLH